MSRENTRFWSLWLLGSLLLGSWLAWGMFGEGNPAKFMPGPLSSGHHQLEQACDACHTDAFGGGEVLQDACMSCHGDIRRKPMDSHPRAKFKDPRNADRLEKINALECVSCHSEHRPQITLKDGLTQPKDVCIHCHDDIADDQPSHTGMGFDTCASAGCHNFHDNRALYTDFLVKHLDDPQTKKRAKVPGREFADIVGELYEYPHDRFPVEPVTAPDSDRELAAAEHDDWLTTAHARSGVNCTACHQPIGEDGNPGEWTDHPGTAGCVQCHDLEAARFQQGKHGMRLASGLPPMTPVDAVLPMREDAAHKELDCTSCHGAHRFDVRHAAVDACLECHDDKHSVAYPDSPHAALWKAESAGTSADNTGVSCATCHMPRIDFDVNDWMSRVMVDHNQSAALSPNSKMIRPACLHCHGLGFSIDALADPALIANNFVGQPGIHVDSMRLAREDNERYQQEMKARR